MDSAKNPIINYFADKQTTELILNKIEMQVNSRYFYCKNCDNCKKLETYRKEFVKKGFWLFNKNAKRWNVFDPDWSYRNTTFEIHPFRYDENGKIHSYGLSSKHDNQIFHLSKSSH